MSLPVGPVGLLCVQRTFHKGRIYGFISGVGAATADLIFGLIAALGLTYISDFLLKQQYWLRILGGLLLLAIGMKIFFAKKTSAKEPVEVKKLSQNYISAFFLTLFNPSTILALTAVFALFGVVNSETPFTSALALAIGFFTGICLFWFVFTTFVGRFHHKIDISNLMILNKCLGSLIALLGLAAMISVLIRK